MHSWQVRTLCRSVAAFIVSCACAVACSSTQTTDVEPCAAGEVTTCEHESGCTGTKFCEDGVLGPCVCDDAGGAGGAAGSTGGSAGSSGGSAGMAGVSGGGMDAAAGTGGTGGCDCFPPHAIGRCEDGGCVIQGCLDGYLDCNGDPADGCEIDPQTDVSHCGGCGSACVVANGSPVCTQGACEADCDQNFLECDGNPANGCEPAIIAYEDKDGDGYGVAENWVTVCEVTAGLSDKIGDCDDDDDRAHPGAGYYTTSSPTVGFDYNCDGVLSKLHTKTGSCGGCNLGWAGLVPGCGQSASYIFSTCCQTDTWAQACR